MWDEDTHEHIDSRCDDTVRQIYREFLIRGRKVIEPEPPYRGQHRLWMNGQFYLLYPADERKNLNWKSKLRIIDRKTNWWQWVKDADYYWGENK